MNFVIELIKGMVIGLANIIPGVSGGTLMVAMGLYEKLIQSITHLFSRPKKSIHFLLPILLGALIAILLLSKVFSYLLETWPIPTNLAFCGLIVGSIPAILPEVKFKKADASCWIAFAVFFAIVLFGALYSESAGDTTRVLSLSLIDLLSLFFIGIIAAATMVVPGISGSMVLMITGFYEPILNTISNLLDGLTHFNMGLFFGSGFILLPFVLGFVVGIFLIAKLVEWIFKRWKKAAYFAIFGLIAASPLAILIQTSWASLSIFTLLAGIVTFLAGAIGALYLAKL